MTSSFWTGTVARMPCANETSRAARTVASETPGRARPMICIQNNFLSPRSEPLLSLPKLWGAMTGCMVNGMKTSGPCCTLDAPVNPSGATPTMVTGMRFS